MDLTHLQQLARKCAEECILWLIPENDFWNEVLWPNSKRPAEASVVYAKEHRTTGLRAHMIADLGKEKVKR